VAGRVIVDAVTSKRPRTRYTVGREAALLPLLAVLPYRILAAALRRHFPKESKDDLCPSASRRILGYQLSIVEKARKVFGWQTEARRSLDRSREW